MTDLICAKINRTPVRASKVLLRPKKLVRYARPASLSVWLQGSPILVSAEGIDSVPFPVRPSAPNAYGSN